MYSTSCGTIEASQQRATEAAKAVVFIGFHLRIEGIGAYFTGSLPPRGGGKQGSGKIATTRGKDASVAVMTYLWPEMLLLLLAVPLLVAAYVLLLRRRRRAPSATRA